MTAILRHSVVVAGLEVFPTQYPYPVYSIGSSVHAEIQCQLTINGNKKREINKKLSDFFSISREDSFFIAQHTQGINATWQENNNNNKNMNN